MSLSLSLFSDWINYSQSVLENIRVLLSVHISPHLQLIDLFFLSRLEIQSDPATDRERKALLSTLRQPSEENNQRERERVDLDAEKTKLTRREGEGESPSISNEGRVLHSHRERTRPFLSQRIGLEEYFTHTQLQRRLTHPMNRQIERARRQPLGGAERERGGRKNASSD